MAKVLGVNHVAFTVKDMEAAVAHAVDVLGGECVIKFENTQECYKGACVVFGDSILSFLEATDESSFVAKIIEKQGYGVQHIGLDIEDIEGYVANLESKGVRVDRGHLQDGDFPEALVGPKSGFGVVLQLIAWKEGRFDTSPRAIKTLRRKYAELPGLKVLQ